MWWSCNKSSHKELENYSKWKKPAKQFDDLHKCNYPNIYNVECKCNPHRSGCGCLRNAFITKAPNNYNLINIIIITIKISNFAQEFAKRMRALSKHAQDEHVWEEVNGKIRTVTEYCEFHSQKVFSCAQCKSKFDL